MSTRSVVATALVLIGLGFISPVHAQGTTAAASNSGLIIQWSIITAGFALAIAAGLGALGSGQGGGAAVEAIARNPSATNDIRGSLLLGLVLIESLVIYVLLVSLILLFLKPFERRRSVYGPSACRRAIRVVQTRVGFRAVEVLFLYAEQRLTPQNTRDFASPASTRGCSS